MIATFKNDKSVRRTIDIGADVHSSEVDIFVEQSHAGVDVNARFSCDPATADAIASALHVAAAQVRSARGEAVDWKHVEGEQRFAGDMACIMGPTFAESGDDFILIDRADVPRLIAELGAWLAAHPKDADRG